MVRLEFHRRLIGGIASLDKTNTGHPNVFAALPGQPYLLNVRLPLVPKLDCALFNGTLPLIYPSCSDITFIRGFENAFVTKPM